MNARTTNRLRRRLLDELGQNGRLLGKLKKSVAEQSVRYMENGGAFSNHMADMATEESDRESDSLLMDAQGRLIYEIEQALQRMDEGRFGACEACGRPIEERRLEVLPYARFCLHCQEKQERIRRN
jgi:RNA polymerase-binding protein DksA